MDHDEEIRDLMSKLMEAVEASLSTSSAVHDALAELVKNGYEARLFFVANAESDAEGEDEREAGEGAADDEDQTLLVREIGGTPDAGDLRFELTKLDYDFLKSLHIRPETG